MLVDGRNRREACRIAEVEPVTRLFDLDGGDPTAYVLSANIHRRHMTKGQRAMAVAMVNRKATNKGGRGKTRSEVEQVSRTFVAMARTVLDYAGDLADGVLSGSKSLEEAYEKARDNKAKAAAEKAQMGELQANAPGSGPCSWQ